MDLQTTTSGEHHLVVTFFEGKFSTTGDRDLYLMTNDDYILIDEKLILMNDIS